MNAFKLEAGLLHVESKTSLSDHHAWQLTTSLLQGDIGFGGALRVRSCGPRVISLFEAPKRVLEFCMQAVVHVPPGPEIRHSYDFLCGSLSKQCRRYRVAVDKVDGRLKIEKCR